MTTASLPPSVLLSMYVRAYCSVRQMRVCCWETACLRTKAGRKTCTASSRTREQSAPFGIWQRGDLVLWEGVVAKSFCMCLSVLE